MSAIARFATRLSGRCASCGRIVIGSADASRPVAAASAAADSWSETPAGWGEEIEVEERDGVAEAETGVGAAAPGCGAGAPARMPAATPVPTFTGAAGGGGGVTARGPGSSEASPRPKARRFSIFSFSLSPPCSFSAPCLATFPAAAVVIICPRIWSRSLDSHPSYIDGHRSNRSTLIDILSALVHFSSRRNLFYRRLLLTRGSGLLGQDNGVCRCLLR